MVSINVNSVISLLILILVPTTNNCIITNGRYNIILGRALGKNCKEFVRSPLLLIKHFSNNRNITAFSNSNKSNVTTPANKTLLPKNELRPKRKKNIYCCHPRIVWSTFNGVFVLNKTNSDNITVVVVNNKTNNNNNNNNTNNHSTINKYSLYVKEILNKLFSKLKLFSSLFVRDDGDDVLNKTIDNNMTINTIENFIKNYSLDIYFREIVFNLLITFFISIIFQPFDTIKSLPKYNSWHKTINNCTDRNNNNTKKVQLYLYRTQNTNILIDIINISNNKKPLSSHHASKPAIVLDASTTTESICQQPTAISISSMVQQEDEMSEMRQNQRRQLQHPIQLNLRTETRLFNKLKFLYRNWCINALIYILTQTLYFTNYNYCSYILYRFNLNIYLIFTIAPLPSMILVYILTTPLWSLRVIEYSVKLCHRISIAKRIKFIYHMHGISGFFRQSYYIILNILNIYVSLLVYESIKYKYLIENTLYSIFLIVGIKLCTYTITYPLLILHMRAKLFNMSYLKTIEELYHNESHTMLRNLYFGFTIILTDSILRAIFYMFFYEYFRVLYC